MPTFTTNHETSWLIWANWQIYNTPNLNFVAILGGFPYFFVHFGVTNLDYLNPLKQTPCRTITESPDESKLLPVCVFVLCVPWSRLSRFFGDGRPPTYNRESLYNGYINPYYWVDEFIPYYMEMSWEWHMWSSAVSLQLPTLSWTLVGGLCHACRRNLHNSFSTSAGGPSPGPQKKSPIRFFFFSRR